MQAEPRTGHGCAQGGARLASSHREPQEHSITHPDDSGEARPPDLALGFIPGWQEGSFSSGIEALCSTITFPADS